MRFPLTTAVAGGPGPAAGPAGSGPGGATPAADARGALISGGSTAPPGQLFHARACAAAVLAGALAHLWMVLAHPHPWWQAALMLGMAAACLPCGRRLWRSPSAPGARMAMAAALAMAGFHAVLLLAGGSATHAHHGSAHHASVTLPAASGTGPGSLPAASGTAAAAPSGLEAMLMLTAWELGAALLAAVWLHRRRRAGPEPARNPPDWLRFVHFPPLRSGGRCPNRRESDNPEENRPTAAGRPDRRPFPSAAGNACGGTPVAPGNSGNTRPN